MPYRNSEGVLKYLYSKLTKEEQSLLWTTDTILIKYLKC